MEDCFVTVGESVLSPTAGSVESRRQDHQLLPYKTEKKEETKAQSLEEHTIEECNWGNRRDRCACPANY